MLRKQCGANAGRFGCGIRAYPLLEKYQMPMSVFVSSEPVDKKYPAMMTWQQMRSMQGDLVQFYNHMGVESEK
jgi:hypothetical protein